MDPLVPLVPLVTLVVSWTTFSDLRWRAICDRRVCEETWAKCISWKRQSMSARQHQSISDQIDSSHFRTFRLTTTPVGLAFQDLPRLTSNAGFVNREELLGNAFDEERIHVHRLHISSHDILKLTWPKVWGSCRYRCSLLPLHLRVE